MSAVDPHRLRRADTTNRESLGNKPVSIVNQLGKLRGIDPVTDMIPYSCPVAVFHVKPK
jgi:hypothetical protein